MMTARVATGIVVLAMGLSASPAMADHTVIPPVDRSAIPELAGENTVLASESGWTRVRLPVDVDASKMYDFDTEIRGAGRVIALFMMREVAGALPKDPGGVWLMRFGDCDTRACEPNPFSSAWMSSDVRTLRAGIYRIYLVVDGARASATFNIPELEGATRINPTRDVRAKVQTLTPRIQESTTGVVFSAGNEAPFRGRGIALQGQFVDPIGPGVINNDYCLYEDDVPAGGSWTYMPPECGDTLSSTLSSTRTYAPLSYQCCWGFQLALDFLPKAMGSWYTSTTPVEDSGAVAMWLLLN